MLDPSNTKAYGSTEFSRRQRGKGLYPSPLSRTGMSSSMKASRLASVLAVLVAVPGAASSEPTDVEVLLDLQAGGSTSGAVSA